jgi:hypothetical protein
MTIRATQSFEDDGTDVPAVSSRRDSFGQGIASGDDVFGSPHLAEQAARYNASVPKAYQQTSLSGVSTDQMNATLGFMPTSNGQAASTYAVKKWSERES